MLFALFSAQAWAQANVTEGHFGARELRAPVTGFGMQGDNFSWALRQCGDEIWSSAITDFVPDVIGANGKQTGAVYRFRKHGNGFLMAGLERPDGLDESARFGYAIACDADLALVGAVGAAGGEGVPDAGTVYIFNKISTGWRLTGELPQGRLGLEFRFGEAISITPSYVVVSASGENAVYVYRRRDGLEFLRKIVPENPVEGMRFGAALAADANELWIGAPAMGTSAGAVFRYQLSSGAAIGRYQGGTGFGSALTLTDAYAFIGDPNFSQRNRPSGSVAQIDRQSGLQVANIVPPVTGSRADLFGLSLLKTSNNGVLVGAIGTAQLGREAEGAAYWYVPGTSGMQLAQRFAPALSNTDRAELFGSSLALFDNDFLIGSSNADAADHPGQGQFYRFSVRGDSAPEVVDSGRGMGFDRFAQALATDQDQAIVGSFLADSFDGAETGHADIFKRTRSGWQHQARIRASTPQEEQRLGIAVDIDGDIAAIGAYWEIVDNVLDAGAVYLYRRVGDSWQFFQRITAQTPRQRAYFGFALAISGNRLMVGARGDAISAGDQGSVTAYLANAAGQFAQPTLLSLSDAGSFDYFGAALDIKGNTAIIGAPGVTRQDVIPTGRAYLYQSRNASNSWTLVHSFIDTNGGNGDGFGFSVALREDENQAVIGTPFATTFNTDGVGAAYLGDRVNATTWKLGRRLMPPNNPLDAKPGNGFGNAVGISQLGTVVGASGFDFGALRDSGRAYWFGADGIFQSNLDTTASSRAGFGRALSLSAARAVIGAPGTARVDPQEGAAYEFLAADYFGSGFE